MRMMRTSRIGTLSRSATSDERCCACKIRAYAALGRRIAHLLCILLPSGLLGADSPATGVLYPDIREPFRSVFLRHRPWRQRRARQCRVRTVADSDSPADIRRWIEDNDIRSVVALGSRGQALSNLAGTVPMVLGAVHMSQDLQERRHYGIALSPDPTLLLERLNKLAPSVKRVTVVYHRERDHWTIERARVSAGRLGIELNAIPVDRLQEAVSAYRTLISTQDSRTDALWLSQDSAVLDEQAVLPMILKEAWDRKLIVFSSNPSHVRRGILFALYPDNYRMGRSLGKMADRINKRAANGATVEPGMEFLRDLSMAFNVRTAGHLGVRYSKLLMRRNSCFRFKRHLYDEDHKSPEDALAQHGFPPTACPYVLYWHPAGRAGLIDVHFPAIRADHPQPLHP